MSFGEFPTEGSGEAGPGGREGGGAGGGELRGLRSESQGCPVGILSLRGSLTGQDTEEARHAGQRTLRGGRHLQSDPRQATGPLRAPGSRGQGGHQTKLRT